MRAAIFGYNHSDYYVDLVMAFERGYRTGTFVIPSPPPPPEEEPKKDKKRKGDDASDPKATKPAKDRRRVRNNR